MASGIVTLGQVFLQDCQQDEEVRNQPHYVDAWRALIRILECQELKSVDRLDEEARGESQEQQIPRAQPETQEEACRGGGAGDDDAE